MPRILIGGAQLPPGSVGPRQVRGNPTTKAATPPIEVRKFCNNGDPVSAQYWNLLNEATIAAAMYRGKQVFSWSSRVGVNAVSIPSSAAGTRNRWRAAFHLGPYSTRLMARVVLCPPNNNYGNASYGRLTIFSDTAEATAVATADFYYGAAPGTTTVNGYQYLKEVMLPVEGLTADTDYTLRFDDINYGRIVCASVFELPSLTEGLTGYLPISLNQDSEVLHVYRQNVATVQKNLCRRGQAHLLNWTVDNQASPVTRTSGTDTNILDNGAIAYAASEPAFGLKLTGHDRLSQTSGIPCVMKAWGYMSTGSALGRVNISNASGTVNTEVEGVWGTTASWQSVAITLPATEDRYFIAAQNFSAGVEQFNLGAVSIYPHET